MNEDQFRVVAWQQFLDVAGHVTAGGLLILRERMRQIDKEGWTSEHDDQHDQHELALAAACYAAPAKLFSGYAGPHLVRLDEVWPWDENSDKRDPDVRAWFPDSLALLLSQDGGKRFQNGRLVDLRKLRIRELEKAGALIAAEIDRLLRLEGK